MMFVQDVDVMNVNDIYEGWGWLDWSGKEMEEKYQSSNKVKAEKQENKMLYTTDETLKLLGKKSVNTIKDWVEKGYIKPPKKIGRFNYYDANDILRLLENGTQN